MWIFFPKNSWVDKNGNILTIRTQSPIGTYFSVQSRDISNYDVSEIYI